MTVVYYSLVCDRAGVYERQWARSVRSLRRDNPEVAVALCLYGPVRHETLEVAGRNGVEVHRMGEYADAFGDVPQHWRLALTTFPTLHKMLSLRRLTVLRRELVYLDCDTYIFGAVAGLAGRAEGRHWRAREEPNSRGSPHGYDATYLDEDALATIARAEGLLVVPPYNTGVFVLSAGLAPVLVTLLDDFIWYAWRLLLGACLWRPELVEDALLTFVLAAAGPNEHRVALAYPSSNLWILEEIATWLLLGRVPDLTHAVLDRQDVAQGEEYVRGSRDCVVAHYYTNGEARFLACPDVSP